MQVDPQILEQLTCLDLPTTLSPMSDDIDTSQSPDDVIIDINQMRYIYLKKNISKMKPTNSDFCGSNNFDLENVQKKKSISLNSKFYQIPLTCSKTYMMI